MRTAIAFSLVLASMVLTYTACGGDDMVDADPFPTMQACFDEHHGSESLSVNDSIVVCCLDHPLGDAMTHPSCKDTVADCVAYLGSDAVGKLGSASATPAEVMAACMDYISKKGM